MNTEYHITIWLLGSHSWHKSEDVQTVQTVQTVYSVEDWTMAWHDESWVLFVEKQAMNGQLCYWGTWLSVTLPTGKLLWISALVLCPRIAIESRYLLGEWVRQVCIPLLARAVKRPSLAGWRVLSRHFSVLPATWWAVGTYTSLSDSGDKK